MKKKKYFRRNERTNNQKYMKRKKINIYQSSVRFDFFFIIYTPMPWYTHTFLRDLTDDYQEDNIIYLINVLNVIQLTRN